MSWATNLEIQALIDKKDFEHENYTEEEKEWLLTSFNLRKKPKKT